MQINSEPYGMTERGVEAEIFILKNDSGATVKITNYGGIITDILVPDKDGKLVNVVLGFDKIEDYFSEGYKNAGPYFGAIIGRYANRIANGRFEIDGETYQIPCNLGNISLHGGFVGFDKKIWKAKTGSSENEISLELSYLSKHLEEGFPGNLKVTVNYSWNNKNELRITYFATTDKATHLNLTNHAYFNLNGCKRDILNHMVSIQSNAYTEVDENSIPTGKLQKVDGSCMDFRTPQRIGERIEETQGNGYDHNFVVTDFDGSLKPAANVYDQTTGIKLEVLTTEPGVQFYTANYLDGSLSRGNIVFSKRMGFCFETQHFPDSPNQPSFPTTLLEPGVSFKSRSVYKFSNL